MQTRRDMHFRGIQCKEILPAEIQTAGQLVLRSNEPKDGDPPHKKKKGAALEQLFGETFEVRAAARS